MPSTGKAYQDYESDLSGQRLQERPVLSVGSMPRNRSDDIVLSASILPRHYDKNRSKTGGIDIVLPAHVFPGNYDENGAVIGVHGAEFSFEMPLHGSITGKGAQSKQKGSAFRLSQHSPTNIDSRDSNLIKTSVLQSCFFTLNECDGKIYGRKATATKIARVDSDCQIVETSSTRRAEFNILPQQSISEKNFGCVSGHTITTEPTRMRSPPKRSKNDIAILNSLARVASKRMVMTAEDEQFLNIKHSACFQSTRGNRCQSFHNRIQGQEDPLLKKHSRHLQPGESSRDLNQTLFSTTTTTFISNISHHRLERGDSTSTRNSRMPQRSISPQSSCSSFYCDDNSVLSELTEEDFMNSQVTLGSYNDIVDKVQQ